MREFLEILKCVELWKQVERNLISLSMIIQYFVWHKIICIIFKCVAHFRNIDKTHINMKLILFSSSLSKSFNQTPSNFIDEHFPFLLIAIIKLD